MDKDRPQAKRDRYFDDMITRINFQLEEAVARGTSPYAIYGLEDDDADDWCWERLFPLVKLNVDMAAGSWLKSIDHSPMFEYKWNELQIHAAFLVEGGLDTRSMLRFFKPVL